MNNQDKIFVGIIIILAIASLFLMSFNIYPIQVDGIIIETVMTDMTVARQCFGDAKMYDYCTNIESPDYGEQRLAKECIDGTWKFIVSDPEWCTIRQELSECLYECCNFGEEYYIKKCNQGYVCVNHTCVPLIIGELDQKQDTSIIYHTDLDVYSSQSFITNCFYLKSVELSFAGSLNSSILFRILSDDGTGNPTNADIIYEATIIHESSGWETFFIPLIEVVPGQKYFIQLYHPIQGNPSVLSGNNVYPYGEMWYQKRETGSFFMSAFDMAFRTYCGDGS